MKTALVLIVCLAVTFAAASSKQSHNLVKRHLVKGDEEGCIQLGEECHALHHCCGETTCLYPRFSFKGTCYSVSESAARK